VISGHISSADESAMQIFLGHLTILTFIIVGTVHARTPARGGLTF